MLKINSYFLPEVIICTRIYHCPGLFSCHPGSISADQSHYWAKLTNTIQESWLVWSAHSNCNRGWLLISRVKFCQFCWGDMCTGLDSQMHCYQPLLAREKFISTSFSRVCDPTIEPWIKSSDCFIKFKVDFMKKIHVWIWYRNVKICVEKNKK